jgi:patatin-like phospholipase/acyl hydrolase
MIKNTSLSNYKCHLWQCNILSFIIIYLLSVSFSYACLEVEDEYVPIDLGAAPYFKAIGNPFDKDNVCILSLDGGGIRAIAEVKFLSLLEEKTGKHTSQLFDIISGTSAGGIIAAALTTPKNPEEPREKWIPKYTASELVTILETNASKMFKKDWQSLGGLLGPRYKTSSLQRVMNHLFGETTFNKSLTHTMITAYDLNTQDVMFFRSWEGEIFLTKGIAVATGSAPSYFSPHSISAVKRSTPCNSYKLIDGGMIANSCVECTLIEARKIFPYVKRQEIVSLGTGKYKLPLDYSDLRTAGILTWARKAPFIALSSQPKLTDYVMKQNWGACYSRWNPIIAQERSALDDIRAKQLNYLKEKVQEMVTERQAEFDNLAARLAHNQTIFDRDTLHFLE